MSKYANARWLIVTLVSFTIANIARGYWHTVWAKWVSVVWLVTIYGYLLIDFILYKWKQRKKIHATHRAKHNGRWVYGELTRLMIDGKPDCTIWNYNDGRVYEVDPDTVEVN